MSEQNIKGFRISEPITAAEFLSLQPADDDIRALYGGADVRKGDPVLSDQPEPTAIERYRRLIATMLETERQLSIIIDQMDIIWDELTEEEQGLMARELEGK